MGREVHKSPKEGAEKKSLSFSGPSAEEGGIGSCNRYTATLPQGKEEQNTIDKGRERTAVRRTF